MAGVTERQESAVELARKVRVQHDDEALSELLDRLKPRSVTILIEAVFPHGGLTPVSFNRLCDHFELWRDLQRL